MIDHRAPPRGPVTDVKLDLELAADQLIDQLVVASLNLPSHPSTQQQRLTLPDGVDVPRGILEERLVARGFRFELEWRQIEPEVECAVCGGPSSHESHRAGDLSIARHVQPPPHEFSPRHRVRHLYVAVWVRP